MYQSIYEVGSFNVALKMFLLIASHMKTVFQKIETTANALLFQSMNLDDQRTFGQSIHYSKYIHVCTCYIYHSHSAVWDVENVKCENCAVCQAETLLVTWWPIRCCYYGIWIKS